MEAVTHRQLLILSELIISSLRAFKHFTAVVELSVFLLDPHVTKSIVLP
jgi:hypothetical protein